MVTVDQTEASALAAVLAAMSAKGVAVPELAALLGMNSRTLARRLGGELPFSIPELRRIRRALGLTWAEILPEDAA